MFPLSVRPYIKLNNINIVLSNFHITDPHNEGKLGANAMERVAASVYLPTPWLFEPTKRPDDRADYCLEFRIPISLSVL